jgi:hypothetical protein
MSEHSYSQINFGLRCMFPTWSDWNITYTAKGLAKKRTKSLLKYLAYAALFTTLYQARTQGKKLGDVKIPALIRGYLRLALLLGANSLQKISGKI